VLYWPVGGSTWGQVPLSSINGAVYVNGNAIVQGVVNGNVTLACEGRIDIAGRGVEYKDASCGRPTPFQPNFSPDRVDDSLGLIARREVRITGTRSVNIHAAILVTDDGAGFGAKYRYWRLGNPAINLYGSLSQYRRGIVGAVGGWGFRKNYKYDTRLGQMAPPHYPYSAYAFALWDMVP